MAPGGALHYHGVFRSAYAPAYPEREKTMQADIVAQGLELMLYGMGTVVVFLTLLVVATTIMSRLMTRYFPDPAAPAVPARPAVGEQQQAPAVAPQVVAAISAAIHQHRRRDK
jgi:oxaloacetate decarboxylase gamma subunit